MVNKLLNQEGGYVDHPNDKGGATKWGITLDFYRDHVKSEATKKDIKFLKRKEAKEIYKNFFWKPFDYSVQGHDYSDLPPPVGEMVFNYSVNMGWKKSHEILQNSINEFGINITVDGWLGPETVKGCKKVDKIEIVKMISIKASKFYCEIVLENESQKVFLEGWLKRVMENMVFSANYIK